MDMSKIKTCKQCKKSFEPQRPMQTVCSPICASRMVRKVKKDERDTVKKRKEAIKSKSDLAREAQTVFNAWIRERDKDLPCISCGRHHQGQYHAGHYLSVGARPELRFEPINVHRQCAPCNTHLSGNAVLYRIALIKKIGLEKVEWLEGPHPAKKYTVDDLIAIKKEYQQKLKDLKNDT